MVFRTTAHFKSPPRFCQMLLFSSTLLPKSLLCGTIYPLLECFLLGAGYAEFIISNIMVFRAGKYVLQCFKKLFTLLHISKLNTTLEKGKYAQIFYTICNCKHKNLISAQIQRCSGKKQKCRDCLVQILHFTKEKFKSRRINLLF